MKAEEHTSDIKDSVDEERHATETGDNSGDLLGSSSVPQVVEEYALLCYTLKYNVCVIMLKVLGQSACGTSSEAIPAGPSIFLQKKQVCACLHFFVIMLCFLLRFIKIGVECVLLGRFEYHRLDIHLKPFPFLTGTEM